MYPLFQVTRRGKEARDVPPGALAGAGTDTRGGPPRRRRRPPPGSQAAGPAHPGPAARGPRVPTGERGRPAPGRRGEVRPMDAIGTGIVVLMVLLLWVAAAMWGRDTRDGRDWR